MKKARVYISILCVLLFVFPSVYQTVHVVQYHWQKETVKHCCSYHSHCNNGDESYNYPGETKKACPVCEFEFTSFKRNSKVELGVVARIYFDLVKSEIQNFVFSNYTWVITLRGPPNSFIA